MLDICICPLHASEHNKNKERKFSCCSDISNGNSL